MPGSPPRVRGKGIFATLALRVMGITPACAGKSYTRTCYAYNVRDHPRVCGEKPLWTGSHGSCTGDHPRVCGEKQASRLKQCICRGSPPRVRGKVYQDVRGRLDEGITPACAGKSGCHRGRRRCGRDHPRVCGEKRYAIVKTPPDKGSPPRVRGKAKELPPRQCYLGITPACAGKSA